MSHDTIATPASTTGPAAHPPTAPAASREGARRGGRAGVGARWRHRELAQWVIDLPVIGVCMTGAAAAVMGSGRWAWVTLSVYVALTAGAVAWPRPTGVGLSGRLRQGLTAPWDVLWFAFLAHALGRGARGKCALVLMVGCIVAATVQVAMTIGPAAIIAGVLFLHVVAIRPMMKYL